MIPIGRGAAAGFQGGQLVVIHGSLFAQIEREREDGPRWVWALIASQRLRELRAEDWAPARYRRIATWAELADGCPVGWVTR